MAIKNFIEVICFCISDGRERHSMLGPHPVDRLRSEPGERPRPSRVSDRTRPARVVGLDLRKASRQNGLQRVRLVRHESRSSSGRRDSRLRRSRRASQRQFRCPATSP